MTAATLLGYILLAVAAQIAVAALIGFQRHMRDFVALKMQLAGYQGIEPPATSGETPEPALAPVPTGQAWTGERAFVVAEKVHENRDRSVCSFYLRPADGEPLPAFKPGQFLTFALDVPAPDGAGVKAITRCYSLSDAPNPDYYRVSIKREDGGLGSTHFHDRIEDGATVSARAPSGHFYLEPGRSPVVLIAGGIGITPMLSMLNATLERGETREIWLFYGVRNGAEHVMKAHLEALAEQHDNFHLHVCYSRPTPDDREGVDYHHHGRVDVTRLRLTLSFKLYEFYICGPGPMLESIVPALEDWGVPDAHIHYEAFGPASINRPGRKADPQAHAVPAETAPVDVTFSVSGKTLSWDGSDATLLDFAERHGIAMPSGCRAGGCGACQTTIVDGEVAYIQTPDFDPEPGSCLTCVSRPAGDVTVEA